MRLRIAPSIANAIFALAGLLIALMAIVAAINTALSLRVGEAIGAIESTYVPVYGMMARSHVRSLEQSVALRQAALAAFDEQGEGVDRALAADTAADAAVASELEAARGIVADQSARSTGVEDRVLLGRLQVQIESALRSRALYAEPRAALIARIAARDRKGIDEALEHLDAVRAQQNERLEAARREALAFVTSAAHATRDSERAVVRLTLLSLGMAILLGILMAFWIARRMVTAIRRLVAATEAVELGNYDADLPVTSGDEIGRLTRSFNLMLAELRLKERIRDTFGRYLDPKVVSDLLDKPDVAKTGGERRTMTVLFADMSGFTRMSEEVSPTVLVTVLNRYLSVLTEAIREKHGIVDKYLGDGVMAFWGPPFVPAEEQASLACEASLAQLAKFAAFQGELPDLLGIRSYRPTVGIRIGIATGEVIAGNVGSAVSMNYTVMGDPVNVAARLESLNKLYGTSVLLTGSTARLAGEGMVTREVDRVVLAGRGEAMSIFELLCRSGEASEPDHRLVATYAAGLAAFRQGDWDGALQAFDACRSLRPADGPSRVLAERAALFKAQGAPEGWDGSFEALSK